MKPLAIISRRESQKKRDRIDILLFGSIVRNNIFYRKPVASKPYARRVGMSVFRDESPASEQSDHHEGDDEQLDGGGDEETKRYGTKKHRKEAQIRRLEKRLEKIKKGKKLDSDDESTPPGSDNGENESDFSNRNDKLDNDNLKSLAKAYAGKSRFGKRLKGATLSDDEALNDDDETENDGEPEESEGSIPTSSLDSDVDMNEEAQFADDEDEQDDDDDDDEKADQEGDE